MTGRYPSRDWLDAFTRRTRLPDAFRSSAEAHFLPLAHYLASQQRKAGCPLIAAINGGQGTGKTTLAAFLECALPEIASLRAAVVSLDDFYLTRAGRQRLAAEVHPLLETRGPAGTHDVRWLAECLDGLRTLQPGETLRLPQFDKATDDRAPESAWREVAGPVDVILFEGWLVGSRPLPPAALERPINALERDQDPDGRWRRYVNTRLATDYAELFERIDRLVFLEAPDVDAVYRWRLEQERRLATQRSGDAIMDEAGVARFLEYFERTTRDNLERLPEVADAVLMLDAEHRCVAHRFR